MQEEMLVRVGANINDFERKMQKMQKKMDSIGKRMQSVGSGLTKAITVPLAGAATIGVKFALDQEQNFAKVSTLLEGSGADMERYKKKIRDASSDMGVAFDEYSESVYGSISAGIDQADAIEFTGRAAKLAKGGFTDTATAVDIMTTAINAYGLEASDAESVSDMLINTQNLGKTTVDELASSMGAVIPVAKGQNVELDQLATGYAVLTKNGIATSEAGTYMKSMFSELGKSGSEVDKILRDKTGKSFSELSAEGMTVGEVLQILQGEADASGVKMGDLFGSVEAGSAAMVLAGDGGKEFNDILGTMAESSGATEEAFKKMDETAGQKLRKTLNKLKNLGAEIGDLFLPMIAKVADGVSGLVDRFLDMSPQMQRIATVAAVAIGGIAAAIGPLIWIAGTLLTNFKLLLPAIKGIGGAFTFLTGPIGLTIAAIVALGAGLILAYKKSETFRNFIDGLRDKFTNAWQKAIEFKDKVIQAISGVVAMFRGEWLEGRSILSRLGLSEDQILAVEVAVMSIRRKFHDMKERIGAILGEVKGFFVGEFNKVKAWWDRDGRLILDAIATVFRSTFDKLKSVARTGLAFIRNLFEIFAPIVNGIWNLLWPTLLYLAETAWAKIKLVIGVAMDLVRGIVSGVSALIEGDWRKFGEVLKATAGSIKNRVTEFFGNMKDSALRLFDRLTGGGVEKLKNLKERGVQKVIEMKDAVMRWFGDMKDKVGFRINTMKLTVEMRFREMVANTIRKAVEMYNSITGRFADLWTGVRNKTNEIRDGVSNRITRMKDNVVSGVTRMYNRAKDIFSDLKEYAGDKFDDMVSSAKKLPGRIGNALSSMASYAVDGVKKLGNKMASGLENVLNDVIGGLNGLLDSIGLGKGDLIKDVEIPRFSTGTGGGRSSGYTRAFSTGTGRISRDMFGILNDKGPGNGRGGAVQEAIERNGQLLMPQGRDVKVPLKRGDRIYNGAEVQSMMSAGMLPRFSKGTGTRGGNSGKEGGLFSGLANITKNIWNFITKPKEAFQAVLDSVTPSFDGLRGFGGKLAKGAFGMVKNQGFKFIKGIFKENSGALGTGKRGSFMNYRMTTPYSPNAPVPGYPRSFNGGKHYGIDYGTPIGTPVHAPMAGKLSQFWNEGGGKVAKLVSGNLRQFFMHMQTVKPAGNVQAGDLIGRTGNSGRWTTGPHVHWQAQQGTDILNRGTIHPHKVLKGYANGGIVRQHQMAQIAENGPEAIIPLSPHKRGRANALYDTVGRSLGRTGDEAVVRELKRANELNEILIGAVYETEGGDIIMNEEIVGRKVAKHVKKYNDYEDRRVNRSKGRRQ